jgi:hypothetical protein
MSHRERLVRTLVKGLIVATVVTVGSTGLLAPAAEAAVPVTKKCAVTVSTSRPYQYSTVTVNVSKVPGNVRVTTSAKYKLTTTKKTAKWNSKGQASVKYKISGATPNYRVVVNVTANKGNQKYACSTSFTPRKR